MQCCVGLGGNLGNVGETFARSIARLHALGHRILTVSHLFQTTPMGAQAGDPYLNAALVMETAGTPHTLLDELQQIESTLGRRRGVRWGPRVLDLDILLIGSLVIRDDRLEVPHPGCGYRRFVLDPLVEIAANWRHPTAGLTVNEIRTVLLQRPLVVAVNATDSQFTAVQNLLRDFTADGSLNVARHAPAHLTLASGETGRFSLGLPSQGNALTIHPADESELQAVFTAMLDEPRKIGPIPELP